MMSYEHKLSNYAKSINYKSFYKLDLKVKNKIRNLIFGNHEDIDHLAINWVRKNCTSNDILIIQEIIHTKYENVIPECFPKTPQTIRPIIHLAEIERDKILKVIDILIQKNKKKLDEFSSLIDELNQFILESNLSEANRIITLIVEKVGYSHFLIRKILLLDSLNINELELSCVENLLSYSNNDDIISSTRQCYQEEVDFLSLKESIMEIFEDESFKSTLMKTNFFFYQYDHEEKKFCTRLNNYLKISLIDAVFFIKYNNHLLSDNQFQHITNFSFNSNINIIDVLDFYNKKFGSHSDLQVASTFLKHTSAWYEISNIKEFRVFLDTYYTYSRSKHVNRQNQNSISEINEWVSSNQFTNLITLQNTSLQHVNELYEKLEKDVYFKTALFNYFFENSKSKLIPKTDRLFEIMSKTTDLNRTINPKSLISVLKQTECKASRLIYLLLISKNTNNIRYDRELRNLIEEIVINQYEADFISFLECLHSKSADVARYLYEICDENFLSLMSRLVTTAQDVYTIRSKLHVWISKYTDEPRVFLSRARKIEIDQKINKVRNQIDDNRIYVDPVKFKDWFMLHKNNDIQTLLAVDYSDMSLVQQQLEFHLQMAYKEFCVNKLFGISSYLGRRIRHGTFRGVIFSDVISSIESDEVDFLNLHNDLWLRWKGIFERVVDNIVKNELQISSSRTKQGLVIPEIDNLPEKSLMFQNLCEEVLKHSKSDRVEDFSNVVFEYCWLIISYDLKRVNTTLKDRKNQILESFKQEFVKKIPNKSSNSTDKSKITQSFQGLIDKKFTTIYGWFQKPQNSVSQTMISLLFQVVETEVRQAYGGIEVIHDKKSTDIDVIGRLTHVIYDALYIIIYNAAQHGDNKKEIQVFYSLSSNINEILMSVESYIKPGESEEEVLKQVPQPDDPQIDDAHSHENASGIRKLYNLARYESFFNVKSIKCDNRKFEVVLSCRVNPDV